MELGRGYVFSWVQLCLSGFRILAMAFWEVGRFKKSGSFGCWGFGGLWAGSTEREEGVAVLAGGGVEVG